MDTWRIAYQKVHPNVNINYQSIGSSRGVKLFTSKTVDFGASGAPLNAEEQQAAPGAVQIPETIGSVAVGYNIPGIPTKTLKFTGPVLADIFQGKIAKWNDPQIKVLNPGVNLPAHRSDGSGTTYVWTSYLSKESPSWNQTIGASKAVPWPIGVGASGSERHCILHLNDFDLVAKDTPFPQPIFDSHQTVDSDFWGNIPLDKHWVRIPGIGESSKK